MTKPKNKATAISLVLALLYTVSYVTRINFGAIVSEMEPSTGFSRQLLSLSLTGSFITYGIGQIISGIAVDRISPKKLISLGLAVTAGMNALLPLCQSPYAMLAVWCINGFSQSFMFPPIIKILSEITDGDDYKKGTVIVSWGSSVGTILIYLAAPAIISQLSWKWVFWLSACTAAGMLLLWQRFSYTPTVRPVSREEVRSSKILFSPLMLGIMLAIVLQGMLRDGITTWMPSFIGQTYQLGTATAILTGVILPIFSVICFQIASRLYRKTFTNPLLCAGVFYVLATASAGLLYAVTGGNAALSVLSSAVLTGSMHGVNLMLISMLPAYFRQFGITGTATGMLNSCTYIGSAISTYGIAVLSQSAGWKTTVLIWLLIAAAGTFLCFASVRQWNRQFGKQ